MIGEGHCAYRYKSREAVDSAASSSGVRGAFPGAVVDGKVVVGSVKPLLLGDIRVTGPNLD